MRTKRFLSDADFQRTKFLYLPASKACDLAAAPVPPGELIGC